MQHKSASCYYSFTLYFLFNYFYPLSLSISLIPFYHVTHHIYHFTLFSPYIIWRKSYVPRMSQLHMNGYAFVRAFQILTMHDVGLEPSCPLFFNLFRVLSHLEELGKPLSGPRCMLLPTFGRFISAGKYLIQERILSEA